MSPSGSNKCSRCEGELVYVISASKDDQVAQIYQCNKCGELQDVMRYRYKTYDCPGHQFNFSHREFSDNAFSHTLDMVLICDRCGARRVESQDLRGAGRKGMVEIEDPRVFPTLALNKSVAERLLTKEEVKDFWSK